MSPSLHPQRDSFVPQMLDTPNPDPPIHPSRHNESRISIITTSRPFDTLDRPQHTILRRALPHNITTPVPQSYNPIISPRHDPRLAHAHTTNPVLLAPSAGPFRRQHAPHILDLQDLFSRHPLRRDVLLQRGGQVHPVDEERVRYRLGILE